MFELSKRLAMHESLKVAEAASLVLNDFLKSVLHGTNYGTRYPNGLKDIGPALFEIATTRSQIPLDRIRLDQIGLDAETEEEELFRRLSDALGYILQSLTAKEPDILF